MTNDGIRVTKKIFEPKVALELLSDIDSDIKTIIEQYGYPPDRSRPANFGT